MERRHRMVYICYNNEAYMNTGIQRSGATPRGAHTTTAPAGKVRQGKEQFRKDLTAIMVAHDIPYVAQASIGNWNDFMTKVEKALDTDGPAFINVLQPCRLGWGFKPEDTLELARLAVDTCVWPVYEVENGVYKLSAKPKEKKPIVEFYKTQTRFKHLFKPENKEILDSIQAEVDQRWEKVLKLCNAQ
jgi:pyruvate ferredoxin oxidoreductase beta subunit